MFITIDEADARPIYLQVAEEIKGLIARGELAEGAQLPPVRQLAADLGVNLNTVATAYRELQGEGLLSIRHGAGAVVASRTARDKSEEELRKPLRAALTGLVLAGLPRVEIMNLVQSELRALLKGAKTSLPQSGYSWLRFWCWRSSRGCR
jgi:GntR family transcriptional regulator